jgi:uncharacterized protein
MNNRIAGFLVRRANVMFATAIALAVLMMLLTRSVDINGKLEGFYDDDNPYAEVMHKIEDFYPYKHIVQLQLTPADCTLGGFMQSLEELDRSLLEAFQGSESHSLFDARQFLLMRFPADENIFTVLQAVQEIPLLQQLVSDDRQHVMFAFYLENPEDFNLERFEEITSGEFSCFQRIISISQFHIEEQIEESITEDLIRIPQLILLFVALFLLLVYRKLSSLMIVGVNAILGLIPLFWILSLLQVEINMVTVTAIPLVMILSLSDSIHLLTGYFNSGHITGKTERIQYVVSRYITPSFFTSLTTSVAFLSFLFNDSQYMRQFGVVSSIAVMLEFVFTFLALPFLLRFAGNSKQTFPFLSALTNRLLSWQKWGSIVMIGVLVFSLFFVGKLKFKTDYDSFFPLNTALRDNHNEMSHHFQSIIGLDIVIERKEGAEPEKGLNQVAFDLARKLEAIPEVKKVYSYRDQIEFRQRFLGGIYFAGFEKTGNIYSAGGRSRIHISVHTPADIQSIKQQAELLTKDDEPHFSFSYFSSALMFDFINAGVAASLLKSLLFSGMLILIMFLILTRSAVNSLVSLLANLVPLGALILMFVFFGININIGTAVTAVICLGFIVDDTIHILYRKLVLGEELNELGQGLFITSTILAGSFVFFVISNFQPTRFFGILSALVFLVAFISDMMIINWLAAKHTTERKKENG